MAKLGIKQAYFLTLTKINFYTNIDCSSCVGPQSQHGDNHNLANGAAAVKAINSIAATVIIYRQQDPSQIFLEMKDSSHPIKLARGQLCTPGGHWNGVQAAQDANPRATLIRELGEEWSFDRKPRTSEELAELGLAANETFEPTLINQDVQPALDDVRLLEHIKQAVVAKLEPFRDYINTISREALDRADPDNKRDGFNVLVSYFTAGLNQQDWIALRTLQGKFGNISAECISVMTSLDEINQQRREIAFGHDQVLKEFFRLFCSTRYPDADYLPLVEGIESEFIGMPKDSYREYLDTYNILKHPLKQTT